MAVSLDSSQRLIVYTAIFGGYDVLQPPATVMPGVQYVCFTDNPYLKSKTWEIRYCKPSGDPLFQAKRCKIIGHEMLQCDISLWLDGRVRLYDLDKVFDRFTADVALQRHPRRNCIYQEAAHCKRIRRGDPSRIDRALARYRAEGHPPDAGLWLAGVILRRHTPATIRFNEEWWSELATGSARDQISVPVVLRRLSTSFSVLPPNVPRYGIGRHRQCLWM